MTLLKDSNVNARAAALTSWPEHLVTPTELVQALNHDTQLKIVKSPLRSKLVLQFIGSWAYLLAHVLSRSRVYNHDVFNRELRRLEEQNLSASEKPTEAKNLATKKMPLLTLSNHISCIDDPVLWAILLPLNYYYTKTDTVRWSAAAVDICFTKPWHSTFFSLGKTFPILRGVGLRQPAIDFAVALLKHHQWLHLFPEGRVMRNDNQEVISHEERGYKFKWGTAKMILDYFSGQQTACEMKQNGGIRILPFYHLGLDKVLPIGWPYIPLINRDMTVYLRPSAIEMNLRLLKQILAERTLSAAAAKSKSDDEIARIKLTNYLEEEVEKLIEPATQVHNKLV